MVKISINRYIISRIDTIRKDVEKDVQKLRKKMLRNLEEIFRTSSLITSGKIKHQRIKGKMVPITINQRRR